MSRGGVFFILTHTHALKQQVRKKGHGKETVSSDLSLQNMTERSRSVQQKHTWSTASSVLTHNSGTGPLTVVLHRFIKQSARTGFHVEL